MLVISIGSPLLVGVYESGLLIKEFTTDERTSEALPRLMDTIIKSFTCKSIYFARGPGSFMAIKITYIFLRTLQITLNCPLYACDGFELNKNSPIPAMGKLYFIKENGKIRTQVFNEIEIASFELPNCLDKNIFNNETEPLYILPAV